LLLCTSPASSLLPSTTLFRSIVAQATFCVALPSTLPLPRVTQFEGPPIPGGDGGRCWDDPLPLSPLFLPAGSATSRPARVRSVRSEEHTSALQSREKLVIRLL